MMQIYNGEKYMKQLLPHQISDAKFLASKSFAGNFSGMGSGKTLSAITAMLHVGPDIDDSTGIKSINIVIAPPIALSMWSQELSAAGFTPGVVKTAKQKLPVGDVMLMSYDIATKRAASFDRVNILICDESHALKSVKAKRTKAILGAGGLVERCRHSWMLTGTPVTRWNDDLFPFLCRAGYEELKENIGGMSMEKFQLKYCIMQKRTFPGARFPTKMVVGSRNTEELNDVVFKNNMAVRHELADVWKNMPPITHTRLPIELSRTAEVDEVLKMLDETNMQDLQDKMTSKDESISSARRIIGLGKVAASAEEIITRVRDGNKPILVGAWHRQVIDQLVEEIGDAGLNVASLDGRTSSKEKDKVVEDFNTKSLDVLVGQISAMGVSLNLQRGGSHIIVVEEDWSPSIMDQFYARLHRMGQEHGVHVDTLIAETKLDRAVERINKNKRTHHGTLMENAE